MPVLLLSLLHLVGCGFTVASTTVLGSASEEEEPALDSADTGDSDLPQDTGEPDPWKVDDDGDGWSEEDGDCDDNNSAVHPEAPDICDDLDNDCDGDFNEDSVREDPFEPNDVTPVNLGDLGDGDMSASGLLHNDDDQDRFQFYVEDHWLSDRFPVAISLSNLPSGATYRLTLNRLRSDGSESLGQVDQVFGSGSLSLGLEDVLGDENGGDYEVVVEAIAGADCGLRYLLSISGS